MNYLVEILKIILPSIIVFFTVYFVLKLFLNNEQKKRTNEISLKNKEVSLPLRLQAYERLVLLLERIAFENLIPRIPPQSFTSYEYQSLLIKTIRQEFEHNLSQQLYVSSEIWETIKNAKEETISAINSAAAKVQNDSPAIQLSSMIFENVFKTQETARHKALDLLKKEARMML